MSKLNVVSFGSPVFSDGGLNDSDVICVGDTLRDCGYPDSATYATGVRAVPWPLLAQWLSQGMRNAQVFSAAVSTNFDCVDIAQLLYRAGFVGKYRVVAQDMPNPDLILREVLAMCPGLDFVIEPCIPVALIRAC